MTPTQKEEPKSPSEIYMKVYLLINHVWVDAVNTDDPEKDIKPWVDEMMKIIEEYKKKG